MPPGSSGRTAAASGAVRIWVANDSSAPAFSTDVVDLLSWSSTGILAFGWTGPAGPGEYLLNTNSTGGSLLADSRLPLCLPSQSLLSSCYGYLTPDGTKIIVPLLPVAVPPGQRPACPQRPSSPGTGQPSPGTGQPSPGTSHFFPNFEEFSATTGTAIGVIYTGPSSGVDQGGEVFWSNASGSALVLTGVVRRGPGWHVVYGVLSGGRFTPIPGAPSSVTLLAF